MSTGQFSLADAQPVPSAGGKGKFRLADAQPAGAGGDASGTKGQYSVNQSALDSARSNLPKAPTGDYQPTAAQLGYDPISSHTGGVAREALLGGLSGVSGLPESTDPMEGPRQAYKGSLGVQIGQHLSGDPNAPGYLDMMKQHNPLAEAYGTAKGLYGAGKEFAIAKTPEEVAHGAGSFAGQLLQLSSLMKGGEWVATKPVTEAARLIERHNAINESQVSVANEQVRKPLQLLDAKISDQIGKQVDPVLRADELHMKMTGSQVGYINGAEAAAAAQKASAKIGGDFPARVGNLIDRAQQPMTLRDVKALTSEVGKWMSNTKDAREARVLGDLYDGLHEASQSRANDLETGLRGSGYGKAWQNYIDQARSWNDMKRGVVGNLMDDSAKHSETLKTLINPDNQAEVTALTKKMKDYGMDPKPITAAREIATDLETSSQQTKNVFLGKIRAIQKYPVPAGAGAAAAAYIGGLSHIPGASFILPLLIAGRIGGMLDMTHIRTILSDIKRNNPPATFDPGATYHVGEGWRPGGAKPGAIPPEASGAPPPSERGGPTAPPRPGASMLPSAPAPKEATPGEVDDMAEAQQGEESRQAMARKVSRTKRSKKP